MKRILLFIVLVITIIFSCGFQSVQELERKSGGYTETELINSGRIGVMKSDGTVFFEGFYIAPNGNYFPLNENALKGETISTSTATPVVLTKEAIPQTAKLKASDITDSEQKTLIDVVSSFVNAQIKAGIQTSLDEILKQGLITNELIGADGKKYQIASTQDGFPLMIKDEIGEWCELTAKHSDEILNFAIGTSIDGYEGAQTNQKYRNTAGKYFSLLYLDGQIMPINTQSGNWDSVRNAMELAKSNNQILYIHPGFYPAAETDNIRKGSVDEIKKYIKKRIDNLLDLVSISSEKPTFLNFVNEASWDYKIMQPFFCKFESEIPIVL